MEVFPKIKKNSIESGVGLYDIRSLRMGSYIRGHIQDPIYCVYILKQLKYFWKSYMKEYVEATQEVSR